MPDTYEALGIKFLYPDNWTVTERDAEEGIHGVTFELPAGGFFNIERAVAGAEGSPEVADEKFIETVQSSISADYGEVEQEEIPVDNEGDRTVEFRFFYLDLLIVSRLMMVTIHNDRFMIQIQAESRVFEENEPVFGAIMQQLMSV